MAFARLFNRLALRIAALVAGVVFLANLLVVVLLPTPRLVVAIVVALVAGTAVYVTAYAVIARRIELAHQTLRETRKRRFETLAAVPRAHPRDELDELVYQTHRVGRALQQEIERLEKLENYRREFLGDVSHELRTPIFAISGFAETLLDGALEDEEVCRRFIEKIGANAHRLDALTRDLGEISRIETGELKMTTAPFDLGPVVQETAESLEMMARDRGIDMTIQVSPGLPRTIGDRHRIRQVLANLVENAIKYNEPGGHVEVIVRRRSAGLIQVAVVDDGFGIPPDAIPRLTERFFRVDRSRSREQGGTGLGLAIVKHTIEAHGARLDVESRAGYGSKFTFELPTEAG